MVILRRKIRMREIFYFGLILQCIVLYGGIDINFKSFLQKDLPQFQSTNTPPAERLVLFVADGLRAERLYTYNNKQTISWLTKGAWGISVASVPTESRPGHVAMLAGIYEDPSAIFKGWQDNPVDFDSVINQSAHTFGWGSPDILNLFNKENHPHIHFYTYNRNMQDFNNPSVELDRWVMKEVENMFDTVKNNHDCGDFCSSKNIYFLHLLGMDNAGHVDKPYSKKYAENMKYLNTVVDRVEILFQEFFKDNKTTYIFTADHGMTDWGSHGSGSAFETHVPVVAWGAGVSKGRKRNIKQNDLAPLISSLIGINIPTNSLGRLPSEYLNVEKKVLAGMILANIRQYAALYSRLEDSRRNIFNFQPFEPFARDGLLQEEMDDLEKKITLGNYNYAITLGWRLMNMLEDGRKYYLTYCKELFTYCLTFSMQMYVIFLIISSTDNYDDGVIFRRLRRIPNILLLEMIPLFLVACMTPIAFLLVYWSALPLSSYLYVSLPFVSTALVLMDYKQLFFTINNLCQMNCYTLLAKILVYGAGVVFLFLSFYNRIYFIPILIGCGIWGWNEKRLLTVTDRVLWVSTCFCVGLFTLLPAVAKSDLLMHGFGIGVWILITTLLVKLFSPNPIFERLMRPPNVKMPPFKVQICVFVLCLIIGYISRLVDTIPLAVNITSFYLLGVITILPFFVLPVLAYRLLAWLFAFMSYYALVTVEYELLFMLAYAILLCLWIIIEDKLSHFGHSSFLFLLPQRQQFMQQMNGEHDLRRAFFYLAFALLGFFGTGNFASLSSFDPMWVKPLITSFSPFIITGLIIVKISIPFMMCTIALYSINILTPGQINAVFTTMLVFCELMLMGFLSNIQTEGSWLDIGTSLSRFIVCGVFILVLMVYYKFAKALLTRGFVPML